MNRIWCIGLILVVFFFAYQIYSIKILLSDMHGDIDLGVQNLHLFSEEHKSGIDEIKNDLADLESSVSNLSMGLSLNT